LAQSGAGVRACGLWLLHMCPSVFNSISFIQRLVPPSPKRLWRDKPGGMWGQAVPTPILGRRQLVAGWGLFSGIFMHPWPTANFKLQIPSTKHQRSSQPQTSREYPCDHRFLELEFWRFSGAWMLVLGASVRLPRIYRTPPAGPWLPPLSIPSSARSIPTSIGPGRLFPGSGVRACRSR